MSALCMRLRPRGNAGCFACSCVPGIAVASSREDWTCGIVRLNGGSVREVGRRPVLYTISEGTPAAEVDRIRGFHGGVFLAAGDEARAAFERQVIP